MASMSWRMARFTAAGGGTGTSTCGAPLRTFQEASILEEDEGSDEYDDREDETNEDVETGERFGAAALAGEDRPANVYGCGLINK